MMAKERNSSFRVLNVNDSVANRYVVTKLLRNAGFQVVEAATGKAALDVARAEPMPDVMILDVKLPDLSGHDVSRLIKSDPRTSSIKILQTSATYVTVDKKVQGLDSGADGYLAQPFESRDLVATVNSLTRLIAGERELRDRATVLQERDQRKDEFLAMLAHELRNPLAALMASLPLSDRFEPRDAIEARSREVFRRQVQHLARLVDDLLDVSRVTRGRIELRRDGVDATELLERVARTLQDGLGAARDQQITVHLPDKQVLLDGDRSRLEQIFANLLDNASKYTDPRGHIALSAAVEQEGASQWLRVDVRDDGIGIDPQVQPGIFGLFTQANTSIARSRGVLGIGLTLVRTLVEMHGGTVTAESEGLGQGSTFTVRLPVSPTAVLRKETELPWHRRAEGAVGRRILIIEDNSDAQQTMVDLCELWGHTVVTASNGLAGVETAVRELPEVAVVDIGLPGIDGYEVARRLRANPLTVGTHLIALTGYGSPEQRDQAIAAGFDLHLVKPVSPPLLRDVLAQALPLRSVPLSRVSSSQ